MRLGDLRGFSRWGRSASGLLLSSGLPCSCLFLVSRHNRIDARFAALVEWNCAGLVVFSRLIGNAIPPSSEPMLRLTCLTGEQGKLHAAASG